MTWRPHARWASEFGIPKAYGSYEELIDDPAIDAVYIPFPNELHKPLGPRRGQCRQAHPLRETARTQRDARPIEMVVHCRRRQVLLMEAFMWRHQPRTLQLIELVQSGAIGELRLIRSSFSFPIDGRRLAA